MAARHTGGLKTIPSTKRVKRVHKMRYTASYRSTRRASAYGGQGVAGHGQGVAGHGQGVAGNYGQNGVMRAVRYGRRDVN